MDHTLVSGDRISHFRIAGTLGSGGMGEVYLAQDLTLERSVALKVLPPQLVRNEERLRRFVIEAKAASSLNHPSIITIYEIGSGAIEREGEAQDPIHFIARLVDSCTPEARSVCGRSGVQRCCNPRRSRWPDLPYPCRDGI